MRFALLSYKLNENELYFQKASQNQRKVNHKSFLLTISFKSIILILYPYLLLFLMGYLIPYFIPYIYP